MPSPFPGMDPYLENPTYWPDVHQRLITYIADYLQPKLRPNYYARIGERIYVVEPPHTMYPDIVLIGRPRLRERSPTYETGTGVATGTVEATVTADAPVVLAVPPVEHREPYVEIVHTGGGEVVTVIEVLSPSNKTPGEGHELYKKKQQEILASPVNLVEIDLLSQGIHTIALSREARASLDDHRYIICVNRATDRYKFEVYPIPLPRRLPRFRIPLRDPDPDVVLDLQEVFNRAYDNGGYADFVNYREPPPAPLSDEEAQWVDKLLREKGLRGDTATQEDTGGPPQQ